MTATETQTPISLRYVDLARTGADIDREVKAASCSRLKALVRGMSDGIASLSFSMDEQGRVGVSCTSSVSAFMPCQLCGEEREVTIQAEFEALLAEDEVTAAGWKGSEVGDTVEDVILVAGPDLDVVELVEDELIMHLPTRVCMDDTCESRPALEFGPAQDAESSGDRQTHRPFAGLDKLVSKG